MPRSRHGSTASLGHAARIARGGRPCGHDWPGTCGGDAAEAASPDPERRKTALAILTAAARLPLPQRQAVLLRDVQGLSYEEVASIQSVSVGTVRSRIAAARQRIADEVGEV